MCVLMYACMPITSAYMHTNVNIYIYIYIYI